MKTPLKVLIVHKFKDSTCQLYLELYSINNSVSNVSLFI
jgi:hypothetical protein